MADTADERSSLKEFLAVGNTPLRIWDTLIQV
jgi:hypothetical protein